MVYDIEGQRGSGKEEGGERDREGDKGWRKGYGGTEREMEGQTRTQRGNERCREIDRVRERKGGGERRLEGGR